jgi:hypothetical protein
MAYDKHFRCHFCGQLLPAWLPVPKRPNGAMLLHHLSQQNPNRWGRIWSGRGPRTLPG